MVVLSQGRFFLGHIAMSGDIFIAIRGREVSDELLLVSSCQEAGDAITNNYTAQDNPHNSYFAKMIIVVTLRDLVLRDHFPGDDNEKSSEVQIELYEKEKH